MLVSTDLVFGRWGGAGGRLRLVGGAGCAAGPSQKAVSALKLEPASLRSLLSSTLPRLGSGQPCAETAPVCLSLIVSLPDPRQAPPTARATGYITVAARM